MGTRHILAGLAMTILAFVGPPATSQQRPEDELAQVVSGITNNMADWRSIEGVRQIRWAPLPPTMLQNCLADGGCFTRSGAATIGGRPVTILATGARTMTGNVYIKNTGTHYGETPMVDALRRAGLAPELARCPIRAGDATHNSKWWRLKRGGQTVAHVSLTYACGAQRCEGIGVHGGPELPSLDPAELSRYSENCGAARPGAPVSTSLPHQAIAQTIGLAIPRADEAVPFPWAVIRQRLPGVSWAANLAPRDPALAYDNDPNTRSLSGLGEVRMATRVMYLQVTGDARSARLLRMEEGGMHPRGEGPQLLNALRANGFTVTLARCGKVYTESKHTYYRLVSPRTRPAFFKTEERFEGQREQTAYRVYLDGVLPPLLPGETNPGGTCR